MKIDKKATRQEGIKTRKSKTKRQRKRKRKQNKKR